MKRQRKLPSRHDHSTAPPLWKPLEARSRAHERPPLGEKPRCNAEWVVGTPLASIIGSVLPFSMKLPALDALAGRGTQGLDWTGLGRARKKVPAC